MKNEKNELKLQTQNNKTINSQVNLSKWHSSILIKSCTLLGRWKIIDMYFFISAVIQF